jgi:argonaute-like protein implicated in RNA metabolism and viral defense
MSEIKLIRGQVRQIVKEELPNILKEQLFEELKKHVDSRMNEVQKFVKETMDLMNTRQKEVLKYLVESYVGNPNDKAEDGLGSTVETEQAKKDSIVTSFEE